MRTSSTIRAALAFVSAGVACEAAAVDEEGMFASLMLTSDYVDRGVSQSDGHPALQGEVGWRHAGGAFASAWASSVDFDDGDQATLEMNYCIGIERTFAAAVVAFDLTYIDFPGAAASQHYDLFELGSSAKYTLGNHTFGTRLIYTPENAGDSGQALYGAINWTRQLGDHLSLRSHVGRQWFEAQHLAGPNYTDWGVLLEWSYGRALFALGYAGSDAGSVCATGCGDRLIAGLRIEL